MAIQTGTIAIGSDHRAREIVDDLASHLEPLGWKSEQTLRRRGRFG